MAMMSPYSPIIRKKAINENDMSKLLKFDPVSVILFVQNSNECYASLQIQNISVTKTFHYVVKASHRKSYKVKEPQGVLNKGRNIIYFKILTSKTQQRLKDRFRIQVTSMPDGKTLVTDYKIAIKHEQVEYKALIEKGGSKQNGGSSNMSMINMTIPSRTNNSTSAVSKLQSSSSAMMRENSMRRKTMRQKTTIIKKRNQINLKTHFMEERIDELREGVNKLESKHLQILVDTGSRAFRLYIFVFVFGLLFGILIKFLLF